MAEDDSLPSFGITITERPGFIEYRGSKDDLIAAGICTEEQFPEGNERKKTNAHLGVPYDQIWSMERRRGDLFVFQLRRDRRRATEGERTAAWDSPEAFKEHVLKYASIFTSMILEDAFGFTEKKRYGRVTLRFDVEDMKKIYDAEKTFLDVIANGKVVWTDETLREREKLEAAAKDEDFRRFINRLLS